MKRVYFIFAYHILNNMFYQDHLMQLSLNGIPPILPNSLKIEPAMRFLVDFYKIRLEVWCSSGVAVKSYVRITVIVNWENKHLFHLFCTDKESLPP